MPFATAWLPVNRIRNSLIHRAALLPNYSWMQCATPPSVPANAVLPIRPAQQRILVVDDEAELRRAMRRMLLARGFDCLEAGNAEAAMQLVMAHSPDLVLCDWHLGADDGVRLLATLRANAATAALPFILITASDDAEVPRRCMEQGADDFLRKPFTPEQLSAAVESRLRQHAIQAGLNNEDLARRRRVEDQLRVLSRAVEQSPASVVITDMAGNIEYVNPKFEVVTGYTAAEARGRNPRLLNSGEISAAVYQELWQTILAGGQWRGELLNRRKNGELYWECATISPIKDDHGCITHFLAVKEDITERKRVEKERDRMEVELRHAQKMQSIGQLAAGIAHEINTPTQYIGDNICFLRDAFGECLTMLDHCDRLLSASGETEGFRQLAQDARLAMAQVDLGYLRAEIPKAIDQSRDGVERVAKIVRAMKEFSHPGVEDKTPLNINHAIESTITVSRNEWKYVAELETRLDPNLPAVPCLPGEFNQVILNLIVNAAHAIGDVVGDGNHAKGMIAISTQREGNQVEIRIRDTGGGIPPTVRHRIFEPFFTTKAVGRGTGQGLAIAHSVIVDKLGGTIHFETEMGRGTTFVIRLPLSSTPSPRSQLKSQKI